MTLAAAANATPPTHNRELHQLGEDIAHLALHISAATYRLLVMLRDFDEQQGWNCGFRSCAHWLAWRTSIELGAAREKVRVARALADLPLLAEAMQTGRVSYSKIRALTRIATPATQRELLNFAEAGTAAHVERLVRAHRAVDRIEALQREQLRHAARYLNLYTDEHGMVVLRARLEPEAGAALKKALEAAEDQLFEHTDRTQATPIEPPSAEQRRADAIGLIAESALQGGLDGGLDKGTRGDRYQVVLHVETTEEHEHTTLDGTHLSAETSRRLSCDAGRVVMHHDQDGNVLDVGRKTRTIHPALRRALDHRDRTCRFPGCDLTHCDAHHIEHWADGGETSLENLALLCRSHHRALHEGGFTMQRTADGELHFHRRNGRHIPATPPPATASADPVRVLCQENRTLAPNIDESSRWPDAAPGDPCDYNGEIQFLRWLRAREAEGAGRAQEENALTAGLDAWLRRQLDVSAETCRCSRRLLDFVM